MAPRQNPPIINHSQQRDCPKFLPKGFRAVFEGILKLEEGAMQGIVTDD
jgi:hypothetical protein